MTLDRVGSADILRGTAGVLEVVLSVDGVPTDPDPSPGPQVTVVDAARTLVVPALAIALGGGSGKLRFIVTPDKTAQVGEWLATWTFNQGGIQQSVTTYHRIVGDVLFTLPEVRVYDGGALANSAAYSDAAILAARDRIADAFAEICGVPFGARYLREVADGDGSESVRISSHRVLALLGIRIRSGATWTALSADELADVIVYPRGLLYRETLGVFPAGRRNVEVVYEHGIQPVPAEIRLAGLRLLRDQLVKSPLDDRATSQAGEFGTFSLATAGRNGSYFGLPLVDEVLNRYRAERLPVLPEMTTTSSVHAFKNALVDGLAGRPALAGVQVVSAPLTAKDAARESIQLGDVDGEQEWSALGKLAREERYTVDVMVWVVRPGSDEAVFRDVRGRAFALFAEVETFLRSDPTVGNVARVSAIRRPEVTEGANPEGRVCRIDFQVAVEKRLPS